MIKIDVSECLPRAFGCCVVASPRHGIQNFKTGKNKGVPLSERDLVLRQQPVSLHLSYPLKPPNILVLYLHTVLNSEARFDRVERVISTRAASALDCERKCAVRGHQIMVVRSSGDNSVRYRGTATSEDRPRAAGA